MIAENAAESTTREDLLKGIKFGDARSHIADHFAVYADPQFIARFLVRYELMKLISNVPGSVVECGVAKGSGLFACLQASRLLDPYHVPRAFVGFDTFAGFPSVSAEHDSPAAKPGEQNYGLPPEYLAIWGEVQSRNWSYAVRSGQDIKSAKYDLAFGASRVFLLRGDFMETGPPFFAANPQFLCALLYLDFDLYEPTKLAIETIVPRMPRGSVIAFDELNDGTWPGETVALRKTLGVNALRLKRFPFEPTMSYAILE